MLRTNNTRRLFPGGGSNRRPSITRPARRPAIARPAFACLLAASLAAIPACAPNISDASLRPLSLAEVAQQRERNPNGTLLIDARGASEFQAGTLPGARNLTLRDIPADVNTDRFDGYDRIIVFGDNPASAPARALAKRLMRAGVKDVYFFEDGYEAWAASRR